MSNHQPVSTQNEDRRAQASQSDTSSPFPDYYPAYTLDASSWKTTWANDAHRILLTSLARKTFSEYGMRIFEIFYSHDLPSTHEVIFWLIMAWQSSVKDYLEANPDKHYELDRFIRCPGMTIDDTDSSRAIVSVYLNCLSEPEEDEIFTFEYVVRALSPDLLHNHLTLVPDNPKTRTALILMHLTAMDQTDEMLGHTSSSQLHWALSAIKTVEEGLRDKTDKKHGDPDWDPYKAFDRIISENRIITERGMRYKSAKTLSMEIVKVLTNIEYKSRILILDVLEHSFERNNYKYLAGFFRAANVEFLNAVNLHMSEIEPDKSLEALQQQMDKLRQDLERERVLREKAEQQLANYLDEQRNVQRLVRTARRLERKYPNLHFEFIEDGIMSGVPFITVTNLAKSGATEYSRPNLYHLLEREEIARYVHRIGDQDLLDPRAVVLIQRHQRRTGRAGVGAGISSPSSGRSSKERSPRPATDPPDATP